MTQFFSVIIIEQWRDGLKLTKTVKWSFNNETLRRKTFKYSVFQINWEPGVNSKRSRMNFRAKINRIVLTWETFQRTLFKLLQTHKSHGSACI